MLQYSRLENNCFHREHLICFDTRFSKLRLLYVAQDNNTTKMNHEIMSTNFLELDSNIHDSQSFADTSWLCTLASSKTKYNSQVQQSTSTSSWSFKCAIRALQNHFSWRRDEINLPAKNRQYSFLENPCWTHLHLLLAAPSYPSRFLCFSYWPHMTCHPMAWLHSDITINKTEQ